MALEQLNNNDAPAVGALDGVQLAAAEPTPTGGGALPVAAPEPMSPANANRLALTPELKAAKAGIASGQADLNQQLNELQQLLKTRQASAQVPYFQMAGALLNPGRTGQFGEALGGAANVLGAWQEENRKQAIPMAQARMQLLQTTIGAQKQQAIQALAKDLYTTDKEGNPQINEAVLREMYGIDPELGSKAVGGIKAMRDLIEGETVKLGPEETLYRRGPGGKLVEMATGKGKVGEDLKEALTFMGLAGKRLEDLSPEQQVGVRNYVDYKKLGDTGIQAYRILGLDPFAALTADQQAALDAKIKDLKKAGAVNVSPTMKVGLTFEEEIMKKVADQVATDVSKVRSDAATQLPAIHQARRAIDSNKVLLGPTAPVAQVLLQIGNTMGVTGKNQDEVLANTRSLMQAQAKTELAAAESMKGQGPITENERGILRRASLGENMTAPEYRALLDINEKMIRWRIQAHNANVQNLPEGTAYFNRFKQNMQVPEPAPYVSPQEAAAELARRAAAKKQQGAE